MTARILRGDCLVIMPTLAASSFDAIVTDPPYGLSFMGKSWDHGIPGSEFWMATLRVLKPGAYLLAFGGTRTYHRLTCAIEDAGFEIHDCISWLYGSGFPKHKSKLKPAWEPIIVARRPADKATPLNIDECRLPATDSAYARNASGDRGHAGTRNEGESTSIRAGGGSANEGGRWPANVVLDEQASLMLDEQTGILTSGANPTRRGSPKTRNTYGEFEGQEECVALRGVDRGGASRFFYCAKASRTDRDFGLDDSFAKQPLNWSSGDQSTGTFQSAGTDKSARNHHPTVKPHDLMRWLCRLVTPGGGLILDPFCGSGSTGRAAVAEGFSFTGIELQLDYALIAEARIAAQAVPA